MHAATWASEPFQALFDRYIPGWREDNFSLRYALSIPPEEIWEAHRQAKQELLAYVNRETNAGMDADVFTIGFARRVATYKRADLLFPDLDRLRRICPPRPAPSRSSTPARPTPGRGGKELIRRVFEAAAAPPAGHQRRLPRNYDI